MRICDLCRSEEGVSEITVECRDAAGNPILLSSVGEDDYSRRRLTGELCDGCLNCVRKGYLSLADLLKNIGWRTNDE